MADVLTHGLLHAPNYGGGTEERDAGRRPAPSARCSPTWARRSCRWCPPRAGSTSRSVSRPCSIELDASSVQPGDVVLGVGVAARPREAVGFVEEAGACGAAAVVLKLGDEPGPELIDASTRTGVALLSAPPAVAWGHLYTLLRVAGGAAMPAGALVDGVPMGDLFALANAIAAMVGGAVTIEDPQSYVLAYSSADLPIDEARREVILGRRVPERFLRRLREAGVFQRLQTTDDVVSYVDQEEDVLPAAGRRDPRRRRAARLDLGGRGDRVARPRRQGRPAGGRADGRPAPDPAPQLRATSSGASVASWCGDCSKATSIPTPPRCWASTPAPPSPSSPCASTIPPTVDGRPRRTPSPAWSGSSASSPCTSSRSSVTSPR